MELHKIEWATTFLSCIIYNDPRKSFASDDTHVQVYGSLNLVIRYIDEEQRSWAIFGSRMSNEADLCPVRGIEALTIDFGMTSANSL